MKLPIRLSTAIFIFLFFFVVWIDLPDGLPIKFSLGPLYVDRVISGPKVDFTLFDRDFKKNFETKLGLDLRGGSHLLFESDISKIPEVDRNQALESRSEERRVGKECRS